MESSEYCYLLDGNCDTVNVIELKVHTEMPIDPWQTVK